MDAPNQAEGGAETTVAEQRRRRGSRWFLAVLFLLLVAWFIVTQVVSRTGADIHWYSDLAEAERVAVQEGKYVFLVLHEPDSPTMEANDRLLLSTRGARDILKQLVCCRIVLQGAATASLRARFGYEGEPLMLVLKPGRPEPVVRLDGRVEWLEFRTYVKPEPDEQ